MAAPNIVNVATITGKTVTTTLANTSQTALLTNTASSGKVFKINMIQVSNIDGTNAADITIDINFLDGGGGSASIIKLVSTISVPADAALVVIDKNTAFYLEEDTRINGTASAGGDLSVTISYEEIS